MTTGHMSLGLIGIETNNWPLSAWWTIIEWCRETFGDTTFGIEWFCTDQYELYLAEEHLTLFALRWY